MNNETLLTVIDVSHSSRYAEIKENMDILHGIIYSAFYPHKDEKKLYQCDAEQKEIRILSNKAPSKSHLVGEFDISFDDIHIYDYSTRLNNMTEKNVCDFMLIGNPVYKQDGRRLPIKDKEGCVKWLFDKSNNLGFIIRDIDTSYIAPYIGKNNIKLNTVQFNGVLEITDSTLFKNTILTGIGHEKGFGFGLLWVENKTH